MQTIANKKNIYSLSMNAYLYADETDPSKIMITKDNFKIELLGRYIQTTNGYYDTPEILDNLVTTNL